MNAWSLLVVSSEGQAGTLPDQRAWAQRTCKERDWTLERVFEDVSSGRKGVRKLMTEMIAALRATPASSRPAWILMIRADRVGRGRIAESQIALHEIVDLGCRIWTRNEGELKLDTAMDQLISAARQATAAFENEVRAEKAAEYYGKRRSTGAASVTNKRPYGLRVVKGGRLEPVPGEAEIISKIFEMRIAGAGATNIGAAVAGIAPLPLKANGDPRKTPPRWMPYTITRMLRNRKYLGTIVDEMTWHRAQIAPAHIAVKNWNTKAKFPWPLAGVIRCYCGAGMYGHPGGHKPHAVIRYYICSMPFNHAGRRKFVRAEPLERQFFELLVDLDANPVPVSPEADPALHLLEAALRSERQQLSENASLRDAVWEMQAAGHVRKEDVQERLDALAAKRDASAKRVAELEVQVAVSRQPPIFDNAEIIAEALVEWPDLIALEQRAVAAVIAKDRGLWVDQGFQLRTGPIPELMTNAL